MNYSERSFNNCHDAESWRSTAQIQPVWLAICLTLILFTQFGCGAAITTVVVATRSDSSSSTPQINTAPEIELDTQAFPSSVTGPLLVTGRVLDGENNSVTISTEITTDNGATYITVPERLIISGNVTGITAAVSGTEFSYSVDLSNPELFGGQTVQGAQIRVRASDAIDSQSEYAISPFFTIANNTPPVLVMQNNDDDSEAVAIQFTIADAESLPVTRQVIDEVLIQNPGPLIRLEDFQRLQQNLPIIPNTLIIHCADGHFIRDRSLGNGFGQLQSLDGTQVDGQINYSTGEFTGTAEIQIDSLNPQSILASYNASYLVVESVEYRNSRGTDGFRPCSSLSINQQPPFPVFVERTGQPKSFVWDALKDLGLGNSKFVQIRVTVTDGDNSVVDTGNSFRIDNGPLGELIANSTLGQTADMNHGDLDNDGAEDIVVVNGNEPAASISTLFNNGNGFDPVRVQSLPIPKYNGVNVINSPATGTRPAGQHEPRVSTLIDVNLDGFLDLVLASQGSSPETHAPDYYNSVFIYFGTGSRLAPFDVVNFWGPIPTGGFGVEALATLQTNDDDNNGRVDDDDIADLLIVSQFCEDPRRTRSREPWCKLIGSNDEDLQPVTGQLLNLTHFQLQSSPVFPGSIKVNIDGQIAPIADEPIIDNILGVINYINGTVKFPIAYIWYQSGLIVNDSRLVGRASPLGALSGQAQITVQSSASISYAILTPMTANDLINDAHFIDSPLQPGDKIEIKGYGYGGLEVVTEVNGQPLTDTQGNRITASTNREDLLPIQLQLTFGVDVTTVGDLLQRIRTTYVSELLNPAKEAVTVTIDPDGFVIVRLEKQTPGPDSISNPGVSYVLPAEISIRDSQSNNWPNFNSSFGKFTIYQVSNSPGGGFHAPELTNQVLAANGSPIFPSQFPSQPILLRPEAPDAVSGRATAPGPGTVTAIQSLLDQSGLNWPLTQQYITAGSETDTLVSPLTSPNRLRPNNVDGNPWLFGLRATSLDNYDASRLTSTDQISETDIAVSCAGDSTVIRFRKSALDALRSSQSLSPIVDSYCRVNPYIQGLYVSQGQPIGDALNTQFVRSAQNGGQPVSLIQPDGESFQVIRFLDVDNDGLLDTIGDLGSYTLIAFSGRGTTVDLPFKIELALLGIGAGSPDIGDFNADGLTDLVVPIEATKETVVLLQSPRQREIIFRTGSLGLSMTRQLNNLERQRATIVPESFCISFNSGAVPHAILTTDEIAESVFRLQLIREPNSVSPVTVDPDVGQLNIATGELQLQISTNFVIDAAANGESMIAEYDQFFFSSFLRNINLVNFNAISFPTGFGPIKAFGIDANRDGLTDTVTLDSLNNAVTLRLQQRTLNLDRGPDIATGLGPLGLDIGDVIQGDGLMEVVCSNTSANSVTIFQVDAVQGLKQVQEVNLSLGSGLPQPFAPLGIEIVDLEQNGGPGDILVACSAVAGASQFRYAGQTDTFSSGFVIIPGLSKAQHDSGLAFASTQIGLSLRTSFEPHVFDVNGDGQLDIFVTNTGNTSNLIGGLTFHLNRGTDAAGHALFSNISSPQNANQLLPLSLPISGTPANPGRVYIHRSPSTVGAVVADLNGDGFDEIILTAGRSQDFGFPVIAILEGKALNDPAFPNSLGEPFRIDPTSSPAGGFAMTLIDVSAISLTGSISINTRDVNNDGRLDIIMTDLTTEAKAGLLINGLSRGQSISQNSFVQVPMPASGRPSGIEFVDLNGDDAEDVVIATQTEPFVLVYLSNLNPADNFEFLPENPNNRLNELYQKPIFLPANPGSLDVRAIDLDGDGRRDLIVSSSDTNTLSLYYQR